MEGDDSKDGTITWNASLETLVAEEAEKCGGLSWLHSSDSQVVDGTRPSELWLLEPERVRSGSIVHLRLPLARWRNRSTARSSPCSPMIDGSSSQTTASELIFATVCFECCSGQDVRSRSFYILFILYTCSSGSCACLTLPSQRLSSTSQAAFLTMCATNGESVSKVVCSLPEL